MNTMVVAQAQGEQGAQVTRIRVEGPGQQVQLPEGASLAQIEVRGSDIILTQPDGSVIIIENGAQFAPQLLIGTQVVNLADVLQLDGTQVAAGPEAAGQGAGQGGSGGNFSQPVGDIGPGAELTPLQLFGVYQFPVPETQEIFVPVVDEEPSVDAPDLGLPGTQVFEAGLPARNGESAGSDQNSNSEFTSGQIVFTPGDEPATVRINGQVVVNGLVIDVNDGTVIGTLTITNFDPAAGTIDYSFELKDNTSGDTTSVTFEVVVEDANGDQATDDLVIEIVDDVPTANDDSNSIPAGEYGPVFGDVDLNDVPGADGASVTGVAGGQTGGESGDFVAQGQYGTLVLNADGTYQYTRNPNTPGGVTDSFTYTYTDSDGDSDTAVLRIDIGDSEPEVFVPGVESSGTIVFEAGLPARSGEPAGTGEIADGNGANDSDTSEATSGLITFTSPDGIKSLQINGVTVANGAVITVTGVGAMTIDSFDAATGEVAYTFRLADNTDANLVDSVNFSVTLTDLDDDVATDDFDILIVDDAPDANDDVDTLGLGASTATGNVITGASTNDGLGGAGSDVVGADDAEVTGVTSDNEPSNVASNNAGVLTIEGAYGTLVLNPDGSYTYTRGDDTPGDVSDVFTYTLTDGDGDTSTATLTISIADAPVTITDLTPAASGGDSIVYESDLNNASATGSDPLGTQEFGTGAFKVSAPDGLNTVTINGVVVYENDALTGNVVTTPEGNALTITGYDSATGEFSYEYELLDNEAHPNANGANSIFDSMDVVATDTDGDSATGTLAIQIVDDLPTISVSGTLGLIQVDESTLANNATGSVASLFTAAFNADGAGSLAYGLQVSGTGAVSGLTDVATGQNVLLYLEAGQVVGRVGAPAGAIAFTLSIDTTTGVVTLDQQRALTHPTADPNEPVAMTLASLITANATIVDSDGDQASASVGIATSLSFLDDGPSISTSGTLGTLTVDETNLGANATGSVASLFISNFGADGAGNVAYALQVSAPGANSGLTDVATGQSVLLYLEAGQVVGRVGSQAGAIAFTFSVDGTTGEVTLDQQRALTHGNTASNNEPANLASANLIQVTATIVDKDGDSASATVNVGDALSFLDDGPSISTTGSIGTLVVDETDLGTNATASVTGLFTSSFGADGAGTVTYALAISSTGANSGLDDTLTGQDVLLFLNAGVVEGRTAVSDELVFTVSLSGGVLTLDQLRAVEHPNVSNPDDAITLLAANLIQVVATVTDRDGDTATASVNIGQALSFEDDGPTLTTATVSANVEEDNLNNALSVGNNEDGAGSIVATGSLSALVIPGADQPGLWGFAGSLPASGLTSRGDAVAYTSATAAGVTTLTATAGGRTVFTLAIVQATGAFTFTLNDQLDHAPGSGENNLSLALGALLVFTDADGDAVALPTGALTINVQDDVPVAGAKTDLMFANATTVGTGTYDYSIGSDERAVWPNAATSDFANLTLAGSVGGVGISASSVTWVSETATSATFNFSFNYAPNPALPGTTVAATGTLVFDKAAGTYTVDFANPIQGFTQILTTSQTLERTGFNLEGSAGQSEIVVSKLSNDFFVRFTGADGTFSSGGNTAYANGESVSGTQSWVSISNDANGVAGDTIQGGELLNMDFYVANSASLGTTTPVGTLARIDNLFLKFDGYGGEDMIVILKLVNPTTGTATTKAVIVEADDVFTNADAVPAGYNFTLDNNDAAVIIERNDYNFGAENWVIVGAQVLNSPNGITGTGIDLDGVTGAGGGSLDNGTDAFTTVSSGSEPVKIVDIGFVTSNQIVNDANLTFSFQNRDYDGDLTGLQTLNVTVESSSNFVGTAAAESIQGTSGADVINGAAGDDILAGGLGADALTGGLGNDVFVLTDLTATDVIVDYAAGDVIDLRALFEDATPGNVNDYVRLQGNILQVDADGAGAGGWTNAATLSNNPGAVVVLYTDGANDFTASLPGGIGNPAP